MTAPIPDNTIRSLALMVGDLPPGDAPKAWFISSHDDVLKGYATYKAEKQKWNDTYQEMLHEAGMPPETKFHVKGGSVLAGLAFPMGAKKLPRWLRQDKKTGYLIPRKRTQEEKRSKVLALFEDLENIPQAATYLPGMPDTLWTEDAAYPIHVRKPSKSKSVLVFLGADPDDANPPFQVGPQWSRMKLSTFYLLRERQEAGQLV